ncbi:MAG: AMP-binding protein [Chryseolinea sp.]
MNISDLDIFSPDERQHLLNNLDKTNIRYPLDETIVSLFAKQVDKTPDSVALKFGEKILTYLELDVESGRVAALLIQKGVKNEEVIGLFVDPSIEAIIGMLAIQKAGCAYLPMDIDYPPERIRYTIQDSGIRIVLCSAQQSSTVNDQCETLCFEDVDDEAEPSSVTIKPSDLCYVIYTSGSTGNPKGVMIEHRNVVRLFFNDAFQFDFGPRDVWMLFHSHCFDFSVWEIYGALLFGAKLVIVPKLTARDPIAFEHVDAKINLSPPDACGGLAYRLSISFGFPSRMVPFSNAGVNFLR